MMVRVETGVPVVVPSSEADEHVGSVHEQPSSAVAVVYCERPAACPPYNGAIEPTAVSETIILPVGEHVAQVAVADDPW